MKEGTVISREDGNTRVELRFDWTGMTLLTTRNGYAWGGCTITDEHIPMIFEVLKEYLAKKGPEYCWECNACGSQEYTMALSEEDVHEWHACSRCGGDEWHKAVCR